MDRRSLHGLGLVSVVLLLSFVTSCNRPRVLIQPTSAMEPTVLKDEKVSAEMNIETATTVARGQVVLFEHEGNLLMKRVIAVGGDTIEGKDLKVFVNGKLILEPYVEHIAKRPLGVPTLENFGPTKVPSGELFVAGDNRDYSQDSRDPGFGLVSLGDVRGKPKEIVWSPVGGRVGTSIR